MINETRPLSDSLSVMHAIQRIDQNVETVIMAIANLQQQLSPILSGEHPQTATLGAQAIKPGNLSLALQRTDEINDKLEIVASTISQIANRL